MRPFHLALVILICVPRPGAATPPGSGGGSSCSTQDCSGADHIVEPAAGGKLIVRQPGGVAGTDELSLEHDGAEGIIESASGNLSLKTSDARYWAIVAGSTGQLRSMGGINGAVFRATATGFKPQVSSTLSGGNDDGIHIANGLVGLVANEVVRVSADDTSALVNGCRHFEASGSAPTCDSLCSVYTDTTPPGAFCWCDGSSWQLVAGSGSCS